MPAHDIRSIDVWVVAVERHGGIIVHRAEKPRRPWFYVYGAEYTRVPEGSSDMVRSLVIVANIQARLKTAHELSAWLNGGDSPPWRQSLTRMSRFAVRLPSNRPITAIGQIALDDDDVDQAEREFLVDVLTAGVCVPWAERATV